MNQLPFPLAVPYNSNGAYLLLCSDMCLAILESEYIPGVHLSTIEISISLGCQVCSICGELCVPVEHCVIHETTCPPVQWLLTIEGMATTREAQKYFSEPFLDEALATIHSIVRRHPSVDPIGLVKRLTS